MKLMVKNERGQSITEYLVLAAVILGAIVIVAKAEVSGGLSEINTAVKARLLSDNNDANDALAGCPQNVALGEPSHCVQDDATELVVEGIGTSRQ